MNLADVDLVGDLCQRPSHVEAHVEDGLFSLVEGFRHRGEICPQSGPFTTPITLLHHFAHRYGLVLADLHEFELKAPIELLEKAPGFDKNDWPTSRIGTGA